MFDFNKAVCRLTLAAIFANAVRQLHPEVLVAEAAASFMPTDEGSLHWLALNLTPGLGPTKGRKPVEHFGGIANIFKATLTELEATGI